MPPFVDIEKKKKRLDAGHVVPEMRFRQTSRPINVLCIPIVIVP